MDSVLQTMVNEKIGPGERAKAFVQSFCETVGVSSGIAFRSYPDCLFYALTAMGVTSGTKVAVSPLSPDIYRTVFDTPYNLIKTVQPDVLVKGSDYKPENIVGYDIVTAKGGKVVTVDLVEGFSTTKTIEKMSAAQH